MEGASELRVPLVGRESELAILHDVLDSGRAPWALVLTGDPGIGKTTLWDGAIAAARERGLRVLSARASGAEAKLSFAALSDLLEEVDSEELARLSSPQRRALEVALLRTEPGRLPPEPRAIALGFLNALRALAGQTPVLVAIDDLPWVDRASADVLAFGARRLDREAVGFLLARRPGSPSAIEHALEPGRLDRLEVGPLSLGAMRRLLSERLALSVPRHLLRRICESTVGNPLFALEIGRMLVDQGFPAIGDELPVPDTVEDLLGNRVGSLPSALRRLLLAVALSADLTRTELTAFANADAVDDAIDAGLLALERDRVRAAHPLLAAAARKHSSMRERRELHVELARVVPDEGLRARHLALAQDRPDAELAATVAAAAAAASTRGARQEAVELGEHALRLSPRQDAKRGARLLMVAVYLAAAGEKERLTDLLAPELDSMPPGSARVQACLLLTDGMIESNEDVVRYLELGLAESGGDPVLRAPVLAEMACNAAGARVEQIAEAERWATDALSAASEADLERQALHGLAWARALRGCAIDDICERFRNASHAAALLAYAPERVAGQRLVWRGELDRARAALTALLSIADDHGEAVSYALLRLHLCELELRAGHWDAAGLLLDEWADPTERDLLPWPMYERCRALAAAGRGLIDEAARWAAEAISRAETTRIGWDRLEALRAQGIAALLAHEPATAAQSLGAIWAHTQREGVSEPGVFPVAPDLVEALSELGQLEEARAVAGRIRGLSEQQEHPWGLATAKRCDAVCRLATAFDEDAVNKLAEAAADYQALGLRFDQARSLLVLGRAERRYRKWGAARRSLEQAAVAFDALGSSGWVEETGAELARVGARRPQPSGELTPAEQRVAELAGEGLANKEIAKVLFITVKTVEKHLSHVYAKLGVRSRAQLTRRLSPRG